MPSTFQSLILTLRNFWANHGCLIAQPCQAQVGAGTMNPAAFLRVLGPEPWNAAWSCDTLYVSDRKKIP